MTKTLTAALCLLVGLAGIVACSPSPTVSSQELADLQQRLAELEAREGIRQLFTDYGRTLDERDYAAFAGLFTETATYGGGGGDVSQGAQAIADQLESVISANASGANLHVYSNERIAVDADARHATAVSRGAFYVQNETGGPMPLMFATYIDELVAQDGRWKFQSRQVIGDIPGPSNESRAAAR